MKRAPSPQSVILTREFDEVFGRMLELSGFEHTSKAQRIRLLSGLLKVCPNFIDDLLRRKSEFVGPIVLA